MPRIICKRDRHAPVTVHSVHCTALTSTYDWISKRPASQTAGGKAQENTRPRPSRRSLFPPQKQWYIDLETSRKAYERVPAPHPQDPKRTESPSSHAQPPPLSRAGRPHIGQSQRVPSASCTSASDSPRRCHRFSLCRDSWIRVLVLRTPNEHTVSVTSGSILSKLL